MDVNHELGSIRHIVDSPLSSKVAMFNRVATQHQNSQLLNPFATVDGRCSPKPTFSKDEYGKPLAGSLTEQRGHKANLHIFKEMLELCQVIDSEGFLDEDNPSNKIIFFGDLFNIYNHISDKCVGLLLRARKHKLVDFEGEMLFQRRDDEVPIFMLKPYKEIRVILEAKQDEIKRAASPAPQPTTLCSDKNDLNKASPAHSPIPNKKTADKSKLEEKNSAASLEFKPIREKSDLSVEITNISVSVQKPEQDEKNDKEAKFVAQTNRQKLYDDATSSASIQILTEDLETKTTNQLEDNQSLSSIESAILKSSQVIDKSEMLSSGSESLLSNVISTATCVKLPSNTKSNVSAENLLNNISIKCEVEPKSSSTDPKIKTEIILEPKIKSATSERKTEYSDIESITSSKTNVPCLTQNNFEIISETSSETKSKNSEQSFDMSISSGKQHVSAIQDVTESQINLIDSSYNLQNGFESNLSLKEIASKEILVSDVICHYEPVNISNPKSDTELEISLKPLIENESAAVSDVPESKIENVAVVNLDKEITLIDHETISEPQIIMSDPQAITSNHKEIQSELEDITLLPPKIASVISVKNGIESKESIPQLTEDQCLCPEKEVPSDSKSITLAELKPEQPNIDLNPISELGADTKTKIIESKLETSFEFKSAISSDVNSQLSENLYSLENEQHSIPVQVSP